MLKMLGAGLIVLASLLTASVLLKARKKKRELLISMQNSLLYLNREIGGRMASLTECFQNLAENGKCETSQRFYRLIREKMGALGEQEFSELWQEAVILELNLLDDREREILSAVGHALAGSDLSALCASLTAAAKAFAERIAQEENKQRDYRRLAFGLTLSLGAFAIIMLI